MMDPAASQPSLADRERGLCFAPQFDDKGLIPVITCDAKTGQVLMLAWMNNQALALTRKSGEMHYWSRSRQEIWHKGATSGQIQTLVSLSVDCDQDCLLAYVTPQGDGGACHLGQKSCFHRELVKPMVGDDLGLIRTK